MMILKSLLVTAALFVGVCEGGAYELVPFGPSSTIKQVNQDGWKVGYTGDSVLSFMMSPQGDKIPLTVTVPKYQPLRINQQGQVAGVYWYLTENWLKDNHREKHLFLQTTSGTFKDLGVPSDWSKQQLRLKPILPGYPPSIWEHNDLYVCNINDLGQILIANALPVRATRFVIWQNDKYTEIDMTKFKRVYALNNKGHLLARIEDEKQASLVIYDPQTEVITRVSSDISINNRLFNDKDQVAFVRSIQHPQKAVGYFWDPSVGKLQKLDNFLPVTAMNNHGHILGVIAEESRLPVLWKEGKIHNIWEALGCGTEDSFWTTLLSLDCINDEGMINGTGLYKDQTWGFILKP